VSPDNLRSQLRLLKECYQVVSPDEVREWVAGAKELPERAVLLTCDDGLRNALTDMAPILREEGLSCLFFALGESALGSSRMLWYEELYLLLLAAPAGNYAFDSLGIGIELGDGQRGPAWWSLVKKLSQYDQTQRTGLIETLRIQLGLHDGWNHHGSPGCWDNEAQRRRFSLLEVDELRQLADQGMSIGSHTLSHPILSQQTSELAWREISESRRLLEDAIGKPVWALAYPFGDPESVTTREMQMAEQAGFQCAFMNIGGGFGAALPRFALPRLHVTADMSLCEFEAHLSGFHRDLRSRLSGEAP